MPPKKKKGGKGAATSNKKKAKSPATPTEPTPYDSLSLQDLQSTVAELEAKHSTLLDAANHTQVEHDAVLSYYEVTKDNLHHLTLEVEQAERTLQQAREDHGLELAVYEDRRKRVQYDHAHRIQEVGEDSSQTLQASRDHHAHREQEIREASREVQIQTGEMQVLQTEEIREARERHARQLEEERSRLDDELVQLERQCQNHHAEVMDDAQVQRTTDLRRAEERGEGRLDKLEAQHQARLEESRTYFEGMVGDNQAVVRSLRDEIDRLEDCADRSDRTMAELTEENERLAEPLAKTLEEKRALAAQSKGYEKDGEVLANTKGRIALTRRRIKDLQKEYQELQKRHDAIADSSKAPGC